MSEANRRTIDTYNGGVQAYIDGTPHEASGNHRRWMDLAFSDVDTSAKVLEIGSAFGRDARYLMEKGYTPVLTDATPAFVEYLRQRGLDAGLLDIVQERPQEVFDVVFAAAVFLHFTEEDFEQALTHVRDALQAEGKFIFSLKQGEGEAWSAAKMGSDRYFHYWRRDDAAAKLGTHGLALIDEQSFDDGKWLYLTARRTGA